jgi:hypothetical protein
MRRWTARVGLLVAVVAGSLAQAPMAGAADFTDVPPSYWDYTAINYVAKQHTWMQDYGSSTFKPTLKEERRLLARSLVKMYAPSEPIDPSITFKDLPSGDPFYPYANVAVKLKWMPKYSDGTWKPVGIPYKRTFDKALILAMGVFGDALAGLRAIHTYDGSITYPVDEYGPYMQLAHWLGFHYNHGDETLDLTPKTDMLRDEVAYSLWKAHTLPSWEIEDARVFADVSLPNLDPVTQAGKLGLTRYALTQIGWPYIWGGEWNAKSPSGYCCGSQPKGGMDCSGFVWWSIKRNEGGYNAAQFHPDYKGWQLLQRSSADMATMTTTKISWGNLRIGDLMFFSSSGGSTASSVDHVGFYLGNNWMIHSSSGNDGVALEPVTDGWYPDHFVFARRILNSSTSKVGGWWDPTGGDGPREGAHPGL